MLYIVFFLKIFFYPTFTSELKLFAKRNLKYNMHTKHESFFTFFYDFRSLKKQHHQLSDWLVEHADPAPQDEDIELASRELKMVKVS